MRAFAIAGVAGAMLMTAALMGQSQAPKPKGKGTGMQATQAIASWKAKPKEVAQAMIGRYGQPQEVTASRLIWHNNGPWKLTELVNEEIAHDFPVPHKDMLVQMINYRIDAGKADELLEYDGSLILERTKGEIGARCDKEEANFLAVNLAHDVATGKRSVGDARAFYAASMAELMKTGKKNDYLQGLRFTVPPGDQGDRDKPFK
ncbi:MAG: hypothetical protein WD690_10655 [Vicinamibacterales bacterium]